MHATNAAINEVIRRLRADAGLSLPNGSGIGQSPVGVGGQIHEAAENYGAGDVFPRGVTFPAILVVKQANTRSLTMSFVPVLDDGLFLVKIHTQGRQLTTGRLIATRCMSVINSITRVLVTESWGRFWVSKVAYVDDGPAQPSDTIGDQPIVYTNLEFRCIGHPA